MKAMPIQGPAWASYGLICPDFDPGFGHRLYPIHMRSNFLNTFATSQFCDSTMNAKGICKKCSFMHNHIKVSEWEILERAVASQPVKPD